MALSLQTSYCSQPYPVSNLVICLLISSGNLNYGEENLQHCTLPPLVPQLQPFPWTLLSPSLVGADLLCFSSSLDKRQSRLLRNFAELCSSVPTLPHHHPYYLTKVLSLIKKKNPVLGSVLPPSPCNYLIFSISQPISSRTLSYPQSTDLFFKPLLRTVIGFLLNANKTDSSMSV